MDDKLRAACPFCGEAARVAVLDTGLVITDDPHYWCKCDTFMCPGSGGGHRWHTEAEAITAWNTRLQALEGAWRPMSEAPKDGTSVDLWCGEMGREPDCYWGLPEHTCGEAGSYCDSDWHSLKPGWVNGTFNHTISAEEASHWRPLPDPPRDQLVEGDRPR